ncbi:ribulose phosphate epimerase [Paraliomyxa miuraensis]|uniref:ribulose phosphate epimerase n=1 Tax=Paraliomyxa miuraensis TaxID=376150 RepID=UPI0022542F41|nr:ribulose phosphate epimerase [Paraliomyxa miuraensis]MCX4242327.1 ribulose phosphate epimerase [Paraliomyxa miuraensis]
MSAGLALSACGTPDGDEGTNTSSPNTTNQNDSGETGNLTMTSGITVDPTNPMTSDGSGMMDGSSGEPATSGVIFLVEPDGGGVSFECDIFAQDCPPGEKCMPWANDGGSAWNATRCSPIAMNPGQPGDECTVEGSGTSGIDDCDLGSMCWDVDPETNVGTCVAMCTGDESNPICEDPDTSCAIANDGAIVLCLPNCDPILQDCAEGQACYPIQDAWSCAPDASGESGVYGDPCEFINVCDPGLICLGAGAVPPGEACEGAAGCCTEVCDLTDPTGDAQCSGQAGGQTCQPWYEEGSAPPGYEDVGACALPA